MNKELIVSAKTVEEALQEAAASFGVSADKLEYEVLEEPKKGFLGVGTQDAKVKAVYSLSVEDAIKDFIVRILSDMELDGCEVCVSSPEKNSYYAEIKGEGLGLIIGHHGDVLDALQYLTNLAVNRTSDKYLRVMLDIENYRGRREDSLRALARKMAARVKKIRRNIPLEPMNPYERRIIHSEIQDIEGVTTFSVGSGDDRKIIVAYEGEKSADAPSRPSSKPAQKKSGNNNRKKDEEPESDFYKPTSKFTFVSVPKPSSTIRPTPIQKVKSIDDLDLADPDEGTNFNE